MKNFTLSLTIFIPFFVSAEMYCEDANYSGWPEVIENTSAIEQCSAITLTPDDILDTNDNDIKLIRNIDLNSDGKCEYIVPMVSLSGTSGIIYRIFSTTKGNVVQLGEVFSNTIDISSNVNGWYSIRTGYASYGVGTSELYTFNGSKYTKENETSVKCESL